MKGRYIIGLLVFVLLFNYRALAHTYMNSIEDPENDLLNIWTGEAVSDYIGFVDIKCVVIYEEEDILKVKIRVYGEIPEVTERRTIYYVLFDRDGDPENNCRDPPFNNCDTMYSIILYEGLSVSLGVFKSWGWDDTTTSAEAYLENSTTLSLLIPKSELELDGEPKELKWRVVSEYEYVGGDFAPDTGYSTLIRYETEAPVKICVPIDVTYVVIDGIKYVSEEGAITAYIPIGWHEIYAPPIINISDDMRYVFVEWSDGVKDNPRKIYIDERGFNSTCRYEIEYRVVVSSPYSETYGSGWYPEGSTVQLGVVKSEVMIGNGTKAEFTAWEGTWGENKLDPTKAQLSVISLSDPIHVVANWRIYHVVTLVSRYDYPRGGGWYPANSYVTISITPVLEFENGTKVVFTSWIGDLTDNRSSLTLMVDKPYTLTAEWDRYFMVSFRFIKSKGEEIIPDRIEITGDGTRLLLTEYVDVWLKEGTYVLTLVEYKKADVKPIETTVLKIDGPKSFTIDCRVYDLKVNVVDPLGVAVSGITASTVLPNGDTLTVHGDGTVLFSKLPVGKYNVRVSCLLYNKSVNVELTEDKEIIVVVPLSATIIAILLVTLGLGGVSYIVYSRTKCVRARRKFLDLREKFHAIIDEVGETYKTPFHLSRADVSSFVREKVLDKEIRETEKLLDAACSTIECSRLQSKVKKRMSDMREEVNRLRESNKFTRYSLDYFLKREKRDFPKLLDILKRIAELVRRYPMCFKCSELKELGDKASNLRNTLVLAKTSVEESLVEMEKLYKEKSEELKRVEEKIKHCIKKLAAIKEFVSRVFEEFTLQKAPEEVPEGVPYAEGIFMGARLRIVGENGFKRFFDKWDKWQKELSKYSREYWDLKKHLHQYSLSRLELEHFCNESKELMSYLSDRNKLLGTAIEGLDDFLSVIDSVRRDCEILVKVLKEQCTKVIDSIIRGDRPLPSEPSLHEVHSELINLEASLRAKCDALRNCLENLEMIEKDSRRMIEKMNRFINNPPFDKTYKEKMKKSISTYEEIKESLEDLVKEIKRERDKLTEALKKCLKLQETVKEVRSYAPKRLKEALSKLRSRLDEAESPEECMKIQDEIWRKWQEYKRLPTLYGEREALLPSIANLDKLSQDMFSKFNLLTDPVNSIENHMVKAAAFLRALELMPKKKEVCTQVDSFINRSAKAVNDAYKASGEIFPRVAELVDKFEERGIVYVSDDFRNFVKVPNIAITWISRATSTVNLISALTKKSEKPEEALEKFALFLDCMSTWLPVGKIPLPGVSLNLYSESLRMASKYASLMRKKIRDILREDIMEELKRHKEFEIENLLKSDPEDKVREIAKLLVEEGLEYEEYAEEYARKYIIDRLLEKSEDC